MFPILVILCVSLLNSKVYQVMSSNCEDKIGSSGATVSTTAAGGHGPLLRASNYAAWAPSMDVFLQRNGAEGVHKKVMSKHEFDRMEAKVMEWADEALAAALALVETSTTGTDPSITTLGSSPVLMLSAEMKDARKLLTAQLERSRKVFGHIWSSLPDELRS